MAALGQAFGDLVTQPVPSAVRVNEAHGARPLPIYDPRPPASVAYRAIADQLLAAEMAS